MTAWTACGTGPRHGRADGEPDQERLSDGRRQLQAGRVSEHPMTNIVRNWRTAWHSTI